MRGFFYAWIPTPLNKKSQPENRPAPINPITMKTLTKLEIP